MPSKLKENFFKFTLKMEIESPAQHSLVSSSLSTAAVFAVLLRNIWTESNSGLARSLARRCPLILFWSLIMRACGIYRRQHVTWLLHLPACGLSERRRQHSILCAYTL